MMVEKEDLSPRPPSVWLVSLWSLLRSAQPILVMTGMLRLYDLAKPLKFRTMDISWLPSWVNDFGFLWLNANTLLAKFSLVLNIVTIVGFLYAAMGIFLGHRWARDLFLILSVVWVIWNIRLIPRGNLGALLRSAIAFSFAVWTFRREKVVAYFGDKEKWTGPLKTRVSGVPLDVGILLILAGLYLAMEVYSVIRNWNVFMSFWN